MSWRKMPPLLLLGLVIQIVFSALRLVGALFITRYGVQKIWGDTPVMFAAILAATGAMLYAIVIAARICTAAAAVVRDDPGGTSASHG